MLGIVVCAVMVVSQPSIDRPALQALLQDEDSAVADLTCEYEGWMSFPQADPAAREQLKLGEDGLHESFAGLYTTRRDGATSAHIFRTYKYNTDIGRYTIADFAGKFEEYMGPVDQKRRQGEILPSNFRRFDCTGSLGRLLLRPYLRGYLDDEKAELEVGDLEPVDGHDCLKVTFTTFRIRRSEKREVSQRDTFWLDLARGAHTLKREIHTGNGELSNRLVDVELKEFKDTTGKSVWLPIGGVYESFGVADEKGIRSYSKLATNREKYWVVPGTTRLNTHPSDVRFTANFNVGTSVIDRVRGKQTKAERSSPPPTIRVDPQASLAQQLRQLEEQGGELKASSWERGGPNWSAWAATSLGAVLVVGCGCWCFRRFR